MSLEFLLLNEANVLINKGKIAEEEGDKESAANFYRKAAEMYERASEKVSPETREIYRINSRRLRAKSRTLLGRNKEVTIVEEEEPDFDSIARSMIVKSSVKFEDIVGMESIKELFMEVIFMATSKPEKEVKLDPPRSVLLYGPPGNGKTLLASALSSSLNSTFFNVNISNVLSRYVGDAPKMIGTIFSLARKMSPSIIFIDEIDSIAISREQRQNVGTGLIQKMLVEMDGFKSQQNFTLVVGSTNRPWDLDEAIINRFDYRIYVPLPDANAREGIFRHEIEGRGFTTEADYKELAENSEGYTGREISYVCKKAIMYMIRRVNDFSEKIIKFDVIKSDEIKRALKETKPTTTSDVLRKFEEWSDSHGSQ
ncbi:MULTISPECIES: AAA family ATPase [Acidianus]|uniref:Cell division protein n=1 Tax=Candidatus Acidianus copahuensis TaxID=1160895 RepID=A0A031LPP1_9CREN|nr:MULTISPECIES: AAA family ATPase [Acidianus]EZQ07057.1 cell division protein [Candidatus Acidianus copahuensis]NON62845.1 AAA family ATPase [Acidianus sp. RZ1]